MIKKHNGLGKERRWVIPVMLLSTSIIHAVTSGFICKVPILNIPADTEPLISFMLFWHAMVVHKL